VYYRFHVNSIESSGEKEKKKNYHCLSIRRIYGKVEEKKK